MTLARFFAFHPPGARMAGALQNMLGTLPGFGELLDRYGNVGGFILGAVMIILIVLAAPMVSLSRKRGILAVFICTVLLNALDSAYRMFAGFIDGLLFKQELTEAECAINGAFNPLSLFLLTMILCGAYKTEKGRSFFFGLLVFGITILMNGVWFIPSDSLWIMIARVVLAALLCRAVAGYKYPFVGYLTMGLYFLVTEAVVARFCYGREFFRHRSVPEGILTILLNYRAEITCVLVITLLMLLFEAYVLEDKATRWKDMKAGTVPAVLVIALAAFGGMFYADMKVDAREALVTAQEEPEEEPEIEIFYEVGPMEGETEVNASSYLISQTGLVFPEENLLDGDPETSWQEGVRGLGEGEYVTIHFERTTLAGLGLLNGSHQYEERYFENGRPSALEVTYLLDDSPVYTETIYPEDVWSEEMQQFLLTEYVECDALQLRILEVNKGSRYKDTAIAEVQIYEAIPQFYN